MHEFNRPGLPEPSEVPRGLSRRSILVAGGAAAVLAAVGHDFARPSSAQAAYANGELPASVLSTISWTVGQNWLGTQQLRTDARDSLDRLNAAFRADYGFDLPINGGYRSYADQVEAKRIYGPQAAEPGTSNHGWGVAIDVGTQSHARISFTSPTYSWLKANAGTYAWVHPAWAEPGGSLPEAWHWEFTGQGTTPPTEPEPEPAELLKETNMRAFRVTQSAAGKWNAGDKYLLGLGESRLVSQATLDGLLFTEAMVVPKTSGAFAAILDDLKIPHTQVGNYSRTGN